MEQSFVKFTSAKAIKATPGSCWKFLMIKWDIFAFTTHLFLQLKKSRWNHILERLCHKFNQGRKLLPIHKVKSLNLYTMEKINVTPFFRTSNYERNYEKSCYEPYVCECCGKKINPKTMKQIQMLESGHWTDEQREVQAIAGGGHSQGYFFVGADCYKEIMKRIQAGNETIEVEF